MDRRRFLKWLGGATAATAAGLLVPSTTSYFLPPAGGWKTPLVPAPPQWPMDDFRPEWFDAARQESHRIMDVLRTQHWDQVRELQRMRNYIDQQISETMMRQPIPPYYVAVSPSSTLTVTAATTGRQMLYYFDGTGELKVLGD